MKHTAKRAFTLIELLIVIAIIGILFIVLVSKVDFATDKAKATGVQTDFRSFQVALETVARENAGFNTFGWDTGDENADRIRNSYDKGDNGLQSDGTYDSTKAQNGIQDGAEVWVGSKEYGEDWNGVYTLVKPGTTGAYDADAIFTLESAINANLDPKLHITIGTDGKITMANQARDPWKNEYHGLLISNSETNGSAVANTEHGTLTADAGDRGAIVIYSDGANGNDGLTTKVEGGLVKTIIAKNSTGSVDNNTDGKDDYSLAVIYTFANGYGEVVTTTTGFSNNQTTNSNATLGQSQNGGSHIMLDAETVVTPSSDAVFRSDANMNNFQYVKVDGNVIASNNYDVTSGSTIVTLKKSYLETLSSGNHKIEIVSSTGTAQATFEVVNQIRFSINGETYYIKESMSFADWIVMSGSSTTSNGIIWVDVNGYLYLETPNHSVMMPYVNLVREDNTRVYLDVSEIITNGATYIGDPKAPDM